MRKFLFFLLLLPALASLGLDAYSYYLEPEKDFRLSDLGAIWDKHHKESHDQWKIKVQEIGNSVDEFIPENIIPKDISLDDIIPEEYIPKGLLPEKEANVPAGSDIPPTTETEANIVVEEVITATNNVEQPANNFSEGFTQSISRDGKTEVKALTPKDNKESTVKGSTRTLIFAIGFLLEQKAILVLGAIPAFFFFLNLILSTLSKAKEEKSDIKGMKEKKKKGGGYTYSRK